jgi:hypothetical protein
MASPLRTDSPALARLQGMAGTVNTIDRTGLPRWLIRQKLTVKNQLISNESREQVE